MPPAKNGRQSVKCSAKESKVLHKSKPISEKKLRKEMSRHDPPKWIQEECELPPESRSLLKPHHQTQMKPRIHRLVPRDSARQQGIAGNPSKNPSTRQGGSARVWSAVRRDCGQRQLSRRYLDRKVKERTGSRKGTDVAPDAESEETNE